MPDPVTPGVPGGARTALINPPTIRPQLLATGRIRLDSTGRTGTALNRRSCWSRAVFVSWWRVEDSNLCSFRDGFTVRSHWPLGQPAWAHRPGVPRQRITG